MTRAVSRASLLDGVHVLDGAMATELEARGANIDGPLWSAHVLEAAPEMITAVHRAYIEAGADCIETASYQVSRMGYVACGYAPERADTALVRSVELARAAAAGFSERRIVVAASLGPYGAALHNGAEYSGNYGCSFADLVSFHRERIAVLANADVIRRPDLLAFETLPSLEEARALTAAFGDFPAPAAWFSFTCCDSRHVVHGELLRDCAALIDTLPQTVAIGINCTHPGLIVDLIGEIRAVSQKPIVVYPNSGEGWDAARRCWTGTRDASEFSALAETWFRAGAQIVGGCCRTAPEYIRAVLRASDRVCTSGKPRT